MDRLIKRNSKILLSQRTTHCSWQRIYSWLLRITTYLGPTVIHITCACANKRALNPQSRSSSIKKKYLRCCQLKALKTNDRQWTLELGKNNYTVHTDHDAIFEGFFRGFSPEVQAFVATFNDRPGVNNREMQIRECWPDLYFRTNLDVKNLRYWQRREASGGYSPIQVLIRDFDERSVNYTVKWVDDIVGGRPLGLFWTTSWTEEIWKYPSVQLYDNT